MNKIKFLFLAFALGIILLVFFKNFRLDEAKVENMADQRRLAAVAQKASDWRVRLAAVKKLTDEEALIKVALKDDSPDVQIVAIGKVSNQEVLTKIALNYINDPVRRAAISRLSDKKIIEQIARGKSSGTKEDRLLALSRLEDQEQICSIVISMRDNDMQFSAVENITDIELLAKLYRAGADTVKTKALNKIKGFLGKEKQLTGLIDYLPKLPYELKYLILDRITSQEDICEFIKIEKYGSDSEYKLEKLTNQQYLEDLLRNHPNVKIREKALEQIINPDPQMLIDLALNAEELSLRQVARYRLNIDDILDERLLFDIVKAYQGNSYGDCEDFACMAFRKIKDPEKIAYVALNHPDGGLQSDAIQRIEDEKVLIQILRACADAYMRFQALNKVNDPATLVWLVQNDSNAAVRSDAARKLLLQDGRYDRKKNVNLWTAFEMFRCDAFALNGTQAGNLIELKAVTLEPAIVNYYGELLFDFDFRYTAQHYEGPVLKEAVYSTQYLKIVMKDKKGKVVFQKEFSGRGGGAVESFDASGGKEGQAEFSTLEVYTDLLKPFNREELKKLIVSPYKNLRIAAIGYLDDLNLIADMALKDPEWEVRVSAVKKLDDNALLCQIAKEEPEYKVRRQAINRLNDVTFLTRLVRDDPSEDIRFAAGERLVKLEGKDADNGYLNAVLSSIKQILIDRSITAHYGNLNFEYNAQWGTQQTADGYSDYEYVTYLSLKISDKSGNVIFQKDYKEKENTVDNSKIPASVDEEELCLVLLKPFTQKELELVKSSKNERLQNAASMLLKDVR